MFFFWTASQMFFVWNLTGSKSLDGSLTRDPLLFTEIIVVSTLGQA
jgi:hypothetical protein